jgi:hypothetical protein
MNPQPKQKPIRLKGAAKKKFRKQVYDNYQGICQMCGRYAPLNDQYGAFNVYTCGHVHHIKRVGSGGGDDLFNTIWTCFDCHSKEHGPKWSK